MTETETYNGYTNRETWALCLWLSNDQGLYDSALDVAEQSLKAQTDLDVHPTWREDLIGRDLQEWVTEMFDALDAPEMRSAELIMMAREVGSLWRVDWREVGAAFIPSEHGR